MENTARVLGVSVPDRGYQQRSTVHERVKGNGREIAVAKYREIADMLERGEIDGARCQWLDTHGGCLEDDGAAVSGLEFVTRSAYREDGNGEVKLRVLTIEEI